MIGLLLLYLHLRSNQQESVKNFKVTFCAFSLLFSFFRHRNLDQGHQIKRRELVSIIHYSCWVSTWLLARNDFMYWLPRYTLGWRAVQWLQWPRWLVVLCLHHLQWQWYWGVHQRLYTSVLRLQWSGPSCQNVGDMCRLSRTYEKIYTLPKLPAMTPLSLYTQLSKEDVGLINGREGRLKGCASWCKGICYRFLTIERQYSWSNAH